MSTFCQFHIADYICLHLPKQTTSTFSITSNYYNTNRKQANHSDLPDLPLTVSEIYSWCLIFNKNDAVI